MLRMTDDYRTSKDAGKAPLILIVINSTRTQYIFSDLHPDEESVGAGTLDYYDGTHTAGDGGTFGFEGTSAWDARVLQFASISERLAPQQKDLFASLAQTEIGAYSVVLDNRDGYFSQLLGDDRNEQLLGQQLEVKQAFRGDAEEDLITLFTGEISQLTLDNQTLRLVAEAVTAVYPAVTPEESIDILAVLDDGLGIMAQDTIWRATSPLENVFYQSDTWTLTANILKDDLNDAGVIFEIQNDLYSAVRLQIGVNSADKFYVTTGHNVTTTPTTTTYTDTQVLTASDITNPINIQITWDEVSSLLYFRINGTTTSQATGTPFDRISDVSTDTITVGDGWDGKIHSVMWNNPYTWHLVNNLGDNTLTDWPEVVGGVDLPLVNGTWTDWP